MLIVVASLAARRGENVFGAMVVPTNVGAMEDSSVWRPQADFGETIELLLNFPRLFCSVRRSPDGLLGIVRQGPTWSCSAKASSKSSAPRASLRAEWRDRKDDEEEEEDDGDTNAEGDEATAEGDEATAEGDDMNAEDDPRSTPEDNILIKKFP